MFDLASQTNPNLATFGGKIRERDVKILLQVRSFVVGSSGGKHTVS